MSSIVKRLVAGDDLKLSLTALMAESGFAAAIPASLVGSLSHCRLRTAGAVTVVDLSAAWEIVSATGTLAQDGMHVHLSVADMNGQTLGGHLLEGCIIASTCEVVLTEVAGWNFSRKADRATGYLELDAERT